MDATVEDKEPTGPSLVSAVRRLADRAAESRAHALGPHGLDEGQFDVLEALAATSPPLRLTAGDLARHCRVTPGAISQRLTALESAGLVERVREEPDRRTVHVLLTDTGRARLEAAAGDVGIADAELLAPLGDADRAALDTILARWLHGGSVD